MHYQGTRQVWAATVIASEGSDGSHPLPTSLSFIALKGETNEVCKEFVNAFLGSHVIWILEGLLCFNLKMYTRGILLAAFLRQPKF